MSAFEELGVMPEIIRAIEEMGWMLPTPVQTEAVPLILGGGDVLAAAETGSGKTGAFSLPILQTVYESLRGDMEEKAVGRGDKGREREKGGEKERRRVEMSKVDRDPMLAVSPDGLVVQARAERSWGGGRSNIGVQGSGKYYYEVTVTDEGLARVGFSNQAAKLDLGTCRNGYGYGGTGKKSNNRQFDDYGVSYGKGDVIGCLINLDDRTISFTHCPQIIASSNHAASSDLGVAFEIPAASKNSSWFPAVVLKNAEVRMNFGETPFVSLPNGYTGISNAPKKFLVEGNSDMGNSGVAVSSSSDSRSPQCIIIEPTRELAQQVYDEIEKFMKYLQAPSISQALFVGGLGSTKDNIRTLKNGVDIVIGTPGRLVDLVESNSMSLGKVRFFVLDEADRLLDTGNQEMILNMHQKSGVLQSQRLQTLLFSATLHSPEIKKLSDRITKFATWVDLKGKDSVPDTVHHAVILLSHTDAGKSDRDSVALNQMIQVNAVDVRTDGVHRNDSASNKFGTSEYFSEWTKSVKPLIVRTVIDTYQMDQCLIFCRTKIDCDNLEHYLNASGGNPHGRFRGRMEKGKENVYSCVVLHGDRSPQERRENLQCFKDGEVRFLISTDVAARGLDISGLPYVINVTLPDRSEDYVHRVGRVGRADCMGLAISIVSEHDEKVWYHTCPSRGKKCHNTSLTDKGGCCIWYHESQLLKDVEKRLSPEAGNNSVPEIMRLLASNSYLLPGMKAGQQGSALQVYGQQRSNTVSESTLQHLQYLQQPIRNLALVEKSVQQSFWSLKERFAAP